MPVSAGPLLNAVKGSDVSRVEQIIYRGGGAGIDEQGPQGDTPLHWAVFEGSTKIVAHLIAGGADVNAPLHDGNTPLHQAAYRGHTEIAEILIRHGASINARTRAGVTPLDWARRNHHQDIEGVLIAQGARAGRGSMSTPPGLQQDGVSVAHGAESQQDSVMFASLQTLPSVKFIEKHRVTVKESLPPLDDPLTKPAQTGRFRVQLVAMSSESGAYRMWKTYSTRYGEVLDGLDLALEPAEVDGRSFYRVQAGPLTRVEAVSTCDALLHRGQDCVVVNAPAQKISRQ